MKSNEFFEKILFNRPVKLICFIVAIMFYIFYQTSLFEKKSFVIPLTVIENGNVVNVGEITNKINVVIRGTSEDISQVQTGKLNASIDLSNITKTGEYNVHVLLKMSDDLMELDPLEVRIQPEVIKVKVEEKGINFVKIEPSIIGEPSYGYELAGWEVEPKHVEIHGALSMVNQIKSIKTDVIDITDMNSDFDTTSFSKIINKKIFVVNKGPYNIKVKIEPKSLERKFTDVQINPVLLNESFIIDGELPKVSLTLSGTVLNLEDFSLSKNAVKINLSEITEPGEYELPIVFSLPNYLNITESSLEKITVKIIPSPTPVTPENEDSTTVITTENEVVS